MASLFNRALRAFSGRRPVPPAPVADFRAPLAPDAPFAVIGDIHGCDGLLGQLLTQLPGDRQTIIVGDMVDRGEDSAAVLRRLSGREDLICLRGNHEDMMLKFIDTPDEAGERWMRYGGLQTLASFGLSMDQDLSVLRDRLVEAMGAELLAWLRACPVLWQSGNIAVVHAGADPYCALSLQSEKVLMWGHSAFATTPRPDGTWVVHGHTIVDEPSADQGRIAIDTGAYASGHLTAALIAPGECRFITT